MLSFITNLFASADKAQVEKTPVPELSLYHFTACPFCRAVKKQIEILELDIEQRNIYSDDRYLDELIQHGGKKTVPCLRIEHDNGSVQWMYESMDIIAYLQKRFR